MITTLKLAVLSAHFKALQTPGKSEEKAFVRRPKGGVMPLPDFSALLLSFISAAVLSLLLSFCPLRKKVRAYPKIFYNNQGFESTSIISSVI